MASFIQDTLEKIPGVDPRPLQRAQFFSGLNEGPAATASRIAGLVSEAQAQDNSPYYTSNFGQLLPDSGHPLNIGGIPYQGDALLLEKQQAFDRSKIQERIVHPAGWAAFGKFTVTKDVSHLTKASFLNTVGKTTPLFCRLSTVTYGREYPDTARNPRGFAVKFYTDEGNYDMVGLNWPVFFVRDPFQGPDNIRSQQRNPQNFLLDFNAWFDFLANVPESQHAGMMLLSDHATPDGNHFSAYGCHTFKWVNAEGKFVYVKLDFNETMMTQGVDPDYSKRQLFETIKNGGSYKWTMMIQVMTPEETSKVSFDPFDVTKIWPRGQFPMQEVGEIELNRNPEDYHRDVEQAAFSPGSLVPGIELSPDTLLNWRAFFYRDAQYTRLQSANIHQIPVNCPFLSKFHSPDNFFGAMRIDGDAANKPTYVTPTFAGRSAAEAPFQAASNVVSRESHWTHEGEPSEYDQVRELYTRVMTDTQREHLHSNTAKLLKFADTIVQHGYLVQQYAISPAYAQAIFDLLPGDQQAKLDMNAVSEESVDAHLKGKDLSFKSKNGRSFMGMPVPSSA
ncbi:uncharacterized protein IL334_002968 [Kwoniella shivajii]|uniref:Catalase core domain-containing protein n=1 Tax=Kwoniella shivajii TaxID=564305 RepID=A0ABZ1CXD7_9TREE|nr:hypothetical protein IL334_002968 [Kwoniella shivajii]